MDDVYGKIDFAPDGSRFVFRRRYFDQGKDLLLVADARGENARQIADRQFPESITFAAWSPDGETIAFCASTSDENKRQVSSIFLLPTGGGEPRILGEKRWELLTAVAWQPDGKALYVAGQSDLTTTISKFGAFRSTAQKSSASRTTLTVTAASASLKPQIPGDG
jgi:Tol biopolymer transport system component